MKKINFCYLILAASVTIGACKLKDDHSKTRKDLEIEAKEYADKEGGNVKAVECVTTDSDKDGYVTCTIFYGDRQKEDILCTRSADESGCKAKP